MVTSTEKLNKSVIFYFKSCIQLAAKVFLTFKIVNKSLKN